MLGNCSLHEFKNQTAKKKKGLVGFQNFHFLLTLKIFSIMRSRCFLDFQYFFSFQFIPFLSIGHINRTKCIEFLAVLMDEHWPGNTVSLNFTKDIMNYRNLLYKMALYPFIYPYLPLQLPFPLSQLKHQFCIPLLMLIWLHWVYSKRKSCNT